MIKYGIHRRVKELYTNPNLRIVHIITAPQAWVHDTPCCDEMLLKEDIRENWEDMHSAWGDDDDHEDSSPKLRVMSSEEFLMEAAQDRHYPELGEQVYK